MGTQQAIFAAEKQARSVEQIKDRSSRQRRLAMERTQRRLEREARRHPVHVRQHEELQAKVEAMQAELFALVEAANRDGRCKLETHVISQSTPAKMDERLMGCLDKAAERHAPGKHIRMPSGAGHDAQWLARKLPAAMMFVPSIDGISHHWSENTSDEDLVLGAQVFTDGIAEALKG